MKRNLLNSALKDADNKIKPNKVIRYMLIPMLLGVVSSSSWKVFGISFWWTLPILCGLMIAWIILDVLFEVFIWQRFFDKE